MFDPYNSHCLMPLVIGLGLATTVAAAPPNLSIISAEFENGTPTSVEFVNSVVGWDAFFDSGFRGGSSTIGMIEAGTAWFDHEVFARSPGSPAAFTGWANPSSSVANEQDFHATTVAHVLAGSGFIDDGNGGSFTLVGLGMAPEARLVSGGVATEYSATDLGAFSISTASMLNAYRDFFRGNQLGAGVAALDVINSSWGGPGDAASISVESLTIDALARENSAVAHVLSAGNSGNEVGVSFPGNGFNNISVGSSGSTGFLQPSDFSSGGLVDFFNPIENGGTLVAGARVAVDLVAPGENFFLAAYLGNSGGIGAALPEMTESPLPTDRYFLEISGTSYAAPIVAGGIALLKDVAREGLGETPVSHPQAFDTRVMKSVLMAGTRATDGWNNGQDTANVTTQALDPVAGAGMLDLLTTANIYLGQSRGIENPGTAIVDASGWSLSTINLAQTANDYIIDTPFTRSISLTVSLNWFAVREIDPDEDIGFDLAFSNLDLQVWLLGGDGEFAEMVGESRSIYQNSEFLRLDSLAPGQYAMRVRFDEMVFDRTAAIDSETYSLAWNAVIIPEPGASLLAGIALVIVLTKRTRR